MITIGFLFYHYFDIFDCFCPLGVYDLICDRISTGLCHVHCIYNDTNLIRQISFFGIKGADIRHRIKAVIHRQCLVIGFDHRSSIDHGAFHIVFVLIPVLFQCLFRQRTLFYIQCTGYAFQGIGYAFQGIGSQISDIVRQHQQLQCTACRERIRSDRCQCARQFHRCQLTAVGECFSGDRCDSFRQCQRLDRCSVEGPLPHTFQRIRQCYF